MPDVRDNSKGCGGTMKISKKGDRLKVKCWEKQGKTCKGYEKQKWKDEKRKGNNSITM